MDDNLSLGWWISHGCSTVEKVLPLRVLKKLLQSFPKGAVSKDNWIILVFSPLKMFCFLPEKHWMNGGEWKDAYSLQSKGKDKPPSGLNNSRRVLIMTTWLQGYTSFHSSLNDHHICVMTATKKVISQTWSCDDLFLWPSKTYDQNCGCASRIWRNMRQILTMTTRGRYGNRAGLPCYQRKRMGNLV